jgi:putative membrane protein
MKQIAVPLAAGLLAATAAFAAGTPAKKADAAMPSVSIDTPTFVKVASGANEFEIRSSRLAEQKAASTDVKKVAAEIVRDHEKAGAELKAALEKSGKPAPAEPPVLAPKQAAMIKLLEGAEGADFDTLYIDMQAGAHMEAVTLFRNFAGTGDDPNVVAFARETLPALEMHTVHVMDVVQAQ